MAEVQKVSYLEKICGYQLLAWCNDKLAEELGNIFCDQLVDKEKAQLLAEIRKLAIVLLNNLV